MAMAQAARPTQIFTLQQAALKYTALLAGMRLDLFTPLEQRALTADELAAALGLDADTLSLLLYGLVVADLLTVADGRFANSDEASRFLVRGKPTYMGSAHLLWQEMAQAGLVVAETVRTGIPQARHDYGSMSEQELYTTLGGLHAGALARGRGLAARAEFAGHRSVLDAAGGSGGTSIALVEALPDLRATVVDLPNVVPVTRRFIREAGMEERVAVAAADMLRGPVPGEYDAVVLAYFIQVVSREEARAALGNVARSLRAGGTVYVVGQVVDASRVTPPLVALLNVLFPTFYDHGQAYTEDEHRVWMAEAGFVEVTREGDVAGLTLLCGRTPG
jgi:hypothetical protein